MEGATETGLLSALLAAAVRWRRHAVQLVRYGMASATALAADITVYMSLVSAGLLPALAGLIGFGFGVVVHYLIGTRYVFDTTRVTRPRAQLFAEYATAGLVGSVVTTSIIALATSPWIGLAPLPAKLAAVVVNFFAVFTILRVVVFRSDVRTGKSS